MAFLFARQEALETLESDAKSLVLFLHQLQQCGEDFESNDHVRMNDEFDEYHAR
jgi:hypothetical protein